MSHSYTNLKNSNGTTELKYRRCGQAIPLIHCIRDRNKVDSLLSILKGGQLGGTDFSSRTSTIDTNKCAGIPNGSTFLFAGKAIEDSDSQVYLLLKIENENITFLGGARPALAPRI